MIAFKRLDLTRRQEVFDWFHRAGRLGCEYSFVNLYLWGRQHAAFVEGIWWCSPISMGTACISSLQGTAL
ncbi:MAG: hypothetical protein ACLU9S_05540 [Oscillospiraceae bacterium]